MQRRNRKFIKKAGSRSRVIIGGVIFLKGGWEGAYYCLTVLATVLVAVNQKAC